MRVHLVIPLILATVACEGPVGHGTAVGNPPDALLRTAPSASIELNEAEVWGAALEIVPCDPSAEVTWIELGTVDLVQGPEVELPAVQPCSATLVGDGIELEAFEDQAHEISVEIEQVEILLGPTVDSVAALEALDGHHILELATPDWLVDLRDPVLEDDVIINPADPRHGQLVESLSQDSAMYVDDDASDAVEDPERARPIMAAWEPALNPGE